MIDFAERVPIESVTGSEYNPRSITPEALDALQHSIRRFGMVKPLIVNSANNVIVAGHQRKKAATVSIPVETKLNSKKTGSARDENTISRSCLLNYRISTAESIKIQSSDLNGKYTVVKGSYVGSRTGDWKTTMKLKAQ